MRIKMHSVPSVNQSEAVSVFINTPPAVISAHLVDLLIKPIDYW